MQIMSEATEAILSSMGRDYFIPLYWSIKESDHILSELREGVSSSAAHPESVFWKERVFYG